MPGDVCSDGWRPSSGRIFPHRRCTTVSFHRQSQCSGGVTVGDYPDLHKWEAPEGVLRDYDRVWTSTSDAPREYQLACGLATLAAVVENRIYLPFGGDRIYPNLWILVLGPSSFFRKTSSI